DNAFAYCSGLTSVTIRNIVTSIGASPFDYSSGLTSVTIPDAVTSIGYYAFAYCSGLTSITIPAAVTSIGDNAFAYCSGLTSVAFNADSCTSAYRAFNNCTNITNFTFGNNVKVIPAYLCYGLSGLTSVTIPNAVTSIGNYAFDYCSGLTSVTIPDAVTSIGDNAFAYCSGLTSVTIPNAVTSIGNYAFDYCSGLTSVTIGNSVTSIGAYTFYGCSGLTSVTIPDGVTSIGEYAFYYCSGLDTVFMEPETVPSLGDHCFDNNTDNRVFIIPCASYDSYYNHADWYSYRESLNVHEIDLSIIVASNSPYYGSVNVVSQSGHNVYCDSTTIVYAEDDEHCVFDHWSNGNTANPDTLHLNGDSTVTAIFIPNRYTLSVLSNDGSVGSVSGSGSYNYMDTIEIIATATDHHHFVMWNDGNRDNPRQYVVRGDATIIATFAIDIYTVNAVPNDPVRGMVTQSGTEFEYLSPCTVEATAYTGYTFAGWSNGVTSNPYTFAVQSDVELTALFIAEGEEVYTVTVVSADPTMGTVSGGGQAMDGGTITIRATGNPGYHFVRWNDDNTDSVRTVEVHGNVTYTAYFASNNGEGIDDISAEDIKIVASNGEIVLEGAEGMAVNVFDMMGRRIFGMTSAQEPCRVAVMQRGIYLVKVGTLPARKVVVVR
nr:leucine-rich repeat protein [Bacteroidales bacterium]